MSWEPPEVKKQKAWEPPEIKKQAIPTIELTQEQLSEPLPSQQPESTDVKQPVVQRPVYTQPSAPAKQLAEPTKFKMREQFLMMPQADDPKMRELYYRTLQNKGLDYKQAKQFGEIIAAQKPELMRTATLISQTPDDAKGYYERGNVLLEMDDTQGAEADYKKTLELMPENSSALMGLANVEHKRGNHAASELYKNQAIKAGFSPVDYLPQVGGQDVVQAGSEMTYLGDDPEKQVPTGSDTDASTYLSGIADAIKRNVPGAMGVEMIGAGFEKFEDTGKVMKEEGFGSGALNMLTGLGEAVLGAANFTGGGAMFMLPFEQAQNNLPEEASKWLAPAHALLEKYYEGKPPAWLNNTAAIADFAALALVAHGAHKGISKVKAEVKGREAAKTMDEILDELPPETVEAITKDIEEKVLNLEPTEYASHVQDKLFKVEQAAKELKTEQEIITQAGEPLKTIEQPPTTLKEVLPESDVLYNGEIGKVDRGDDGTWYFVNGEGKSTMLKVEDKNNAVESLSSLGVEVLPEIPKENIMKALSDREQTGFVDYKGNRYFVSLGNRFNPADVTGDIVGRSMTDGSIKDPFTHHKDQAFAKSRKLAIINEYLKQKGLPKREALVEGKEIQSNEPVRNVVESQAEAVRDAQNQKGDEVVEQLEPLAEGGEPVLREAVEGAEKPLVELEPEIKQEQIQEQPIEESVQEKAPVTETSEAIQSNQEAVAPKSFKEKHGVESTVINDAYNEYLKENPEQYNKALEEALKKHDVPNTWREQEAYLDFVKSKLEEPLPKKLPPNKSKFSINHREDFVGEVNVNPIEKRVKAAEKTTKGRQDSLGKYVGKDERRPVLSGVFHDAEGKALVITDAHKLVWIKDPSIKESKIIDPKTGRTIEGKFPDYKAVIPEDNPIKAKGLSAQELLNQTTGVERANRFISGSNIYAKIKIGENEFYFDPSLLNEVLSAMMENGAKTIDVELSRPNRAMVLSTPENKNVNALLMPVQAEGLASKTIFQRELTPKERQETIDAEVRSLEKDIKYHQQKLSNETDDWGIRYHKGKISELEQQLKDKRSSAVENPLAEEHDLQIIKENIQDGAITKEEATNFTEATTEQIEGRESAIKNLEGKAESLNETELKEVISESDKLIKTEINEKAKRGQEEALLEETTQAKPELKGRERIANGIELIKAAAKEQRSKVSANPFNDKFMEGLVEIGRGMIEEGLATVENVVEKVREHIKNLLPDTKIDDYVNELKTYFKDEKAQAEAKEALLEETSGQPPVDTGNPPQVAEAYSPEQGKKSLLNRGYEGVSKEDVKSSIGKHGLTYEIESHEVANKKAEQFIEEVGFDNALEAVRKNEMEDGAAAFVWSKLIDEVGREMDSTTDPARLKELTEKQADLIKEFDNKARSSGRFVSALQEVYKSSDFEYSYGKQVEKYKAANDGVIPPEVEQRFREYDSQIKELNRKITELESQPPQIIEPPKVKRQSLSEQKQARKTELASKYRGQFNDVTRILTLLGEKDFREYATLILEETAGDFKAWSAELINNVGEKITEHLPKLYEDIYSSLSSEQAKIKRLEKQLADLQSGKLGEKTTRSKDSKEAQELKAEIERTKEELGLFASKRLPEIPKTKLEAERKRLEQSIENYKKRLEEVKSGKMPEKKVREQSKELTKLRAEKLRVKDLFDTEHEKLRLKNRSAKELIHDGFVDAMNLPKSLMATADMSAPLRQGLVLSAGNPRKVPSAVRQMFKSAFNEKAHEQWMAELRTTEEYADMKKDGLYIAEPNAKLNAREEQYISNIAHRIPLWGKVVKGSERAYSAYLNKLRTDVWADFKDAITAAERDGSLTKEQASKEMEGFSNFINNATGRGNLGPAELAAPLLNSIFFSPRYLISRFNLVNPYNYIKLPKYARKEALKNMAAYVGLVSTVLAMANAGGAEVELDPRSSDFAKIKTGDTRFDIMAGVQQVSTLLSRISSMSTKTKGGKVKTLYQPKGYRDDDIWDVIGRFGRSKASPILSSTIDLSTGEDIVGDPVTVKDEVIQAVAPLYLSDINEIYQEGGFDEATMAGLASFFGVGVQHHKKDGAGAALDFSKKFKD